MMEYAVVGIAGVCLALQLAEGVVTWRRVRRRERNGRVLAICGWAGVLGGAVMAREGSVPWLLLMVVGVVAEVLGRSVVAAGRGERIAVQVSEWMSRMKQE